MKLLTVIIIAFSALTNFSTTNPKPFIKESEYFAKCAMPSFESEFEQSKAIFSGKVVSVRTEGDEKIFKIRVEKYWKGTVSKTVEVRYYESMRYQAWLQVGGRYLVYAKGKNTKNLKDGRCSWTKNYSEAAPDLKKLGKGKTVK